MDPRGPAQLAVGILRSGYGMLMTLSAVYLVDFSFDHVLYTGSKVSTRELVFTIQSERDAAYVLEDALRRFSKLVLARLLSYGNAIELP